MGRAGNWQGNESKTLSIRQTLNRLMSEDSITLVPFSCLDQGTPLLLQLPGFFHLWLISDTLDADRE